MLSAAARQPLRPVTVRPSGGSRRNSAAMRWSCRSPQFRMTRPARPRTFAGVSCAGRRRNRRRSGHAIRPGGQRGTADRVLVAADDERFCPAGLGGPFEQRGGVTVVVAGKLDDALVDPVGLQAVPSAEAVAAHPLGRRQHGGADLGARDTEQPGVAAVDHRTRRRGSAGWPAAAAAHAGGRRARPAPELAGSGIASARPSSAQAKTATVWPSQSRAREATDADSPRVGRPDPDGGRDAGTIAGSERDSARRRGPASRAARPDPAAPAIQRQQRRPCRPHVQQLVHFSRLIIAPPEGCVTAVSGNGRALLGTQGGGCRHWGAASVSQTLLMPVPQARTTTPRVDGRDTPLPS